MEDSPVQVAQMMVELQFAQEVFLNQQNLELQEHWDQEAEMKEGHEMAELVAEVRELPDWGLVFDP